MWSSFRSHYTIVFVTSNVRHHSLPPPPALRPANANSSFRKLFRSQFTFSIHFHRSVKIFVCMNKNVVIVVKVFLR